MANQGVPDMWEIICSYHLNRQNKNIEISSNFPDNTDLHSSIT